MSTNYTFNPEIERLIVEAVEDLLNNARKQETWCQWLGDRWKSYLEMDYPFRMIKSKPLLDDILQKNCLVCRSDGLAHH